MSLQARLLLLSMLDAGAIFATSVLTAGWEFGLRLFFIYRFSKKRKALLELREECEGLVDSSSSAGAAAGGEQTATEAAALRSKLAKLTADVERESVVLTANTGGDMVVEYLGANAAMQILFYFGGLTSAFRFVGGAPSGELVFLALAAQHVPELVCDTLASWYEIRTGLPVREYFHTQMNWRVLVPTKLLYTVYSVFLVLFTMRATGF